jgi:hypothetical protein
VDVTGLMAAFEQAGALNVTIIQTTTVQNVDFAALVQNATLHSAVVDVVRTYVQGLTHVPLATIDANFSQDGTGFVQITVQVHDAPYYVYDKLDFASGGSQATLRHLLDAAGIGAVKEHAANPLVIDSWQVEKPPMVVADPHLALQSDEIAVEEEPSVMLNRSGNVSADDWIVEPPVSVVTDPNAVEVDSLNVSAPDHAVMSMHEGI